jgi:hypothetical protein
LDIPFISKILLTVEVGTISEFSPLIQMGDILRGFLKGFYVKAPKRLIVFIEKNGVHPSG